MVWVHDHKRGWVSNVPNYPCFKIQLSTLKKKVQRTLMSSKSWSGVVEDPGGSIFWFWFVIIVGRVQECSKQPMLQNSTFYIEYKGEKNAHVLGSPGLEL